MSIQQLRDCLDDLGVYYAQSCKTPSLKTKLVHFMATRREQMLQDSLSDAREPHVVRPFPYHCPDVGEQILIASDYPLLLPALAELSSTTVQDPLRSYYGVRLFY
jgi:hypothetical protein